jgi:Carboxypeptidase regulatory-like domain/TonB-dependent Receptor Plug Domain
MRCTVTLVLLFTFITTPARAQFESGAVVGLIRDTTGGVIADASVTLLNTETGVEAKRTSAPDGTYEFVTVRPGVYVVTGEKAGLSVALVENVRVQVGGRMRVDLTMSVGALTERVQVTATAPLLETDRSERSQVITAEQIRQLPLNGREYSALALLSTGVRLSALNRSNQGTPREGAFNVNGLRSVFNNFLIDGVDNNANGTSNQGFSNQVMQPPPDAVAEFKVVTNNQSAEYGRAAGATVNVAYRSGANQFTASAWEFFRDTALNATNYFRPANGIKPPMRRNQFGGVMGGPLLRNRAFFFADYEGFRQDRQSAAFSSIPTASQRQGCA